MRLSAWSQAFASLGVLLFVGLVLPAVGQEPAPSRLAEKPVKENSDKKPTESSALHAAIEESQPSLYYLKDEHGNLVAVPNFKLADFEDLYKLKHQLVAGDARPRFSLLQFSATGSASDSAATKGSIELTVQIRLLVRDEQWTRVPLRLDQAALSEPAQFNGPGEHFLHSEGEGEGYVAWIRGPAGQQHVLTLKMLVPITSIGEQARLRLAVPRTTASEMKLKVPLAKVAAKVSEGATVQTAAANAKESDLTVLGLGGDFELTWYPAAARPAELPVVLEATANVAARMDSRGIDSDAVLTVRSFGAAFDRFRVRLPPEAELAPVNPSGYAIVALDEPHGVQPTGPQHIGGQPRIVEIRLPRPTVGPIEVRLMTTRTALTTKPNDWLELAGFEVLGAARQWGTISVSVTGDWHVVWGPSSAVRQTDSLPDPTRHRETAAAFEYFMQPYSLPVRLAPRTTRIGVEPQYVLFVDADALRLEARLRYSVHGAKVFSLDMSLADWQIDDVGPESVVSADGIPMGLQGASTTIPLAQPVVGQFEVRVRAHRPLGGNDKLPASERSPIKGTSFSVTLPQVQANANAAADVAIVPADNVELIPDDNGIRGLLRQQGGLGIRDWGLEANPQSLIPNPLFYRSDASTAIFAGEVRRHTQKIDAETASQVSLDGRSARIEERIKFHIAYVPADHLTLDMPSSVPDGNIELRLESQPPSSAPLVITHDDPQHPLRIRAALPTAYIGACTVLARYSLPVGKAPPEQSKMVSLPLLTPVGADVSGNQLDVATADDLLAAIHGGAWSARETTDASPNVRRELHLAAAGLADHIDIDLQSGLSGESTTVVERGWVQTWLTNAPVAARQDRAVMQFTTRERDVELTLPTGAAAGQSTVYLDGKRIAPLELTIGVLHIDLPREKDGDITDSYAAPSGPFRRISDLSGRRDVLAGRHVIDVRYGFPGPRPSPGSMAVDLPRLGPDAWVRRLYWELILPREEHVVVSPTGMTGEFAWGWSGFYWGRQPLLAQADLEAWAGVPHAATSAEPTGVNRYLYSTLGNPQQCTLHTVGRSILVLIVSGVVLLVGWAVIYIRLARQPVCLLAFGVSVAALAAVNPEMAILCAQASVVGIALAIVAAIIHQLTATRLETPARESRSKITPLETAQPVDRQVGPAVAGVLASEARSSASRSSRRSTVSLPQEGAT